MNEDLLINKETLKNAKIRGLNKLRIQLVLLLAFVILFFIVGFLVVQTLFDERNILIRYMMMAAIELLLWAISIGVLWKGTILGKFLFTLCGFLSLYAIYPCIQLYQFTFEAGIDKLICILFTVLYICKSITILLCTYRLYHKPISYIWMSEAKSQVEEQEQDQKLIQKLLAENNTQELHMQSRRKINQRAFHNLRRYTTYLIAFIYGALLLFYVGMFAVRYYFPADAKGIEYVQRYILLATLYSAFIWSLPAIGMFLYRKWSKWAILIAWGFEITRFVITISNTISIFSTQQYGVPSIASFLVVEILRYAIFLRLTFTFMKDPFLQAFWKKQKRKQS